MNRSGQRAAKRSSLPGARGAAQPQSENAQSAKQLAHNAAAAEPAEPREAREAREDGSAVASRRTIEELLGARPVAKRKAAWPAGERNDVSAAQADLSRMISELNEVRMRLDAIVRKLATSAVDVPDSSDSVDDVEQLRMRLLGKLDRIREQLVTRLSEERVAGKDR